MNEEDLDLIRRAKRGHMDAFTILVRNYKHFVYRMAYGVLQNPYDAEDVSQEIFLKVHQSFKKLRDERTFPTWLAQISMRTSFDWIKRHKKHTKASLDPELVSEKKDMYAASDIRLDFERSLRQMDVELRTILILREIQGFDYEEIARILKIAIGTVRSRLHRARTQLRLLANGRRDLK